MSDINTEYTPFGMFLRKWGMLIVAVSVILGAGYYFTNYTTILSPNASVPASVPKKLELPVSVVQSDGVAVKPDASDSDPAASSLAAVPMTLGKRIKVLTIPWNATLSVLLANGGASTMTGSLMAKYGISMVVERQDGYDVMKANLITCGQQFSQGIEYPDAACFVIIMGDGAPDFVVGPNSALAKIGTKVRAFGASGFSRGEDKCMLPYAVAENPQLARGMTVVGVRRDGDEQVCLLWAARNNIAVNTDDMMYDPNALNFMAAESFDQAGQFFMSGSHCEDRKVIRDGKATNEVHRTCPDGVATWTPGDVAIAKQVGGLAAVASTASESQRYQMPALIIGVESWMKAHRSTVVNMLRAMFEAGDSIKSSDEALRKASEVAAEVFKEHDADYWFKYFKGSVELDAQGHSISLGGSAVNNLADNVHLFGVGGGANIYGMVYEYFREFNLGHYPTMYPDGIPGVGDILDLGYIATLVTAEVRTDKADIPSYDAGPLSHIESTRSYLIEFESGKAVLRQDVGTQSALKLLLTETITTGAKIEVYGHTDNTGDDTLNKKLSLKRAQAIKEWLQGKSKDDYPDGRFSVIEGKGSSEPVADNAKAEGRQKNRRTEIRTGS